MVELIWDGKYDENNRRVAPLRVELPFQTVETVNESAQQRERNAIDRATVEIRQDSSVEIQPVAAIRFRGLRLLHG